MSHLIVLVASCCLQIGIYLRAWQSGKHSRAHGLTAGWGLSCRFNRQCLYGIDGYVSVFIFSVVSQRTIGATPVPLRGLLIDIGT